MAEGVIEPAAEDDRLPKNGMRRKAICVFVVLIQARQGRSEKGK